jgi:hypothetical protein
MLRLPLAVICLFLCTRCLFADSAALTVDEIHLMLRQHYSSKEILDDLKTRHFAETLDAEWEQKFSRLHASPALIDALKSGRYAASEAEKIELKRFVEQKAIEAKRITQQAAEQQPRIQQNAKIVAVPAQTRREFQSPSEIVAAEKAGKAAKIAAGKSVELEIGQSLNLEIYDGPNVQIAITSVDSHDVTFKTADFDRMIVTVSDGNGGSHPTTTRQQVAVTGNATLLFRRSGISVFYVGSSMNHVTLAIVME